MAQTQMQKSKSKFKQEERVAFWLLFKFRFIQKNLVFIFKQRLCFNQMLFVYILKIIFHFQLLYIIYKKTPDSFADVSKNWLIMAKVHFFVVKMRGQSTM